MYFLSSSFKSLFLAFLVLLLSVTSFAAKKSASELAELKSSVYLSYDERVLASYLLLSYQKSPEEKKALMLRAAEYFKERMLKPKETIVVNSLEEFINKYRGVWPNSGNLVEDVKQIELLPKTGLINIVGSTEAVSKQIEEYKLAKYTKGAAQLYNLPEVTELIKTQNVNGLVAATSNVDTFISLALYKIDHIGEIIANSSLIPNTRPEVKTVMRILFSNYFKLLNIPAKLQIISAFIGDNLLMPDLKKFEIMIQNSGPQLQKILQIVGRQAGLGKKIVEVFRRLESSAQSVPWYMVEKILRTEKRNYEIISVEHEPLGVGSMAQVHKAVIRENGVERSVVLRFLKPGIGDKIHTEEKILLEVAEQIDSDPLLLEHNYPKISPLVNDVTKSVLNELDIQKTIEAQNYARKVYTQNRTYRDQSGYKNILAVRVPRIISPKGQSELIVQELVSGSSLDKEYKEFSNLLPDMKKVIAEQMAALWIEEVIFKSGFYHSDLHQGNFLVRVSDPAIEVSILDFGMTGFLPKRIRDYSLRLGAGMTISNPDIITDSLWNLSIPTENNISKEKLFKLVTEKIIELQKPVSDPKKISHEWVAWSVTIGLHLDPEFLNLQRGDTIINKMLADVGSKETTDSIAVKIARRYPVMMSKILYFKGTLMLKDLIKLGLSQFTKKPEASSTIETNPSKGVVRSCKSLFAN